MTPHDYRKKPVIIQAARLTEENIDKVADWCGGEPGYEEEPSTGAVLGLYIVTKEGTMRAEIGDYIIRGVKGEFYSCKPDIFKETYDSVEDLEDEQSVLDAEFEDKIPWDEAKKELGVE